ncbi:MAG: NADP-dependent isocitrate dehydrogenase [Candidatus Latescibacterota bacterium]|nr:MAG: NADP-dependent isocitrate dehydrogenase [Candidatus Latescibacterota bacterium]
MHFDKIVLPSEGEKIQVAEDKLVVPDCPIIPFIEGDGIGPDIMRAAQGVWNAAVAKAYGGSRKIVWLELFAGEKALQRYGELLPQDTFRAIEHFVVAIKGPLTTPVGTGYRSLNVALRQRLDLYACVRPVAYLPGVPSPVSHPEQMDIVIFRENTEDVYAGIEWPKGSEEAHKVISYLNREFHLHIPQDSGIGVKPISQRATQRLVRKAIQYAIRQGRRSLTIMHKGNIMKYTEGAFRDWAYQVAREEFPEETITEKEVQEKYGGKTPPGKVVIKDRIADSMFQQILTRTDQYDVIATSNLNGDYLSDACAAQVGGLGMAPGANIGDLTALFEATHGTAPKYAGLDVVNPSSLILSGKMMLEYIGWQDAAELIQSALVKTIQQRKVTYDLARQMQDATRVGTSEFASAIVENM